MPFTLVIQAVPPVEGISFLIDGRRFVTNDEGIVRATFRREGLIEVEALVNEFHSRDMQLEFARWGDYVFTPQRVIEITSPLTIEAGFHVSYPVRLHYTDLEGGEIPAERISTVELRNSIGDILTFDGHQVQWMQSIKVLGRDFGLDPVDIVYAVQRVIVDGANVVNRGQQRFTLTAEEAPVIELLLYTVHFTSQDALFRYPLGSGVRLEHPDGQKYEFLLDEQGRLRIDNLARGTYRSTVTGASGLAIPTTFVLSRPQEVEMIVISMLDIVVVSLLGILLLVGLLVVGRPELLDRFMTWVRRRTLDSGSSRSNSAREGDQG